MESHSLGVIFVERKQFLLEWLDLAGEKWVVVMEQGKKVYLMGLSKKLAKSI